MGTSTVVIVASSSDSAAAPTALISVSRTAEVDETYVGGKKRARTRKEWQAAWDAKAPVVALVERGSGKVRAFPMVRVTAENIGKALAEHVKPNAKFMTDESNFYTFLNADNGVFYHVSREHLARYCDEFAFRYENRKASDGERAKMLVAKAEGKRLPYKQPG